MNELKAKFSIELDEKDRLAAKVYGSSYNLSLMFFEAFCESPDMLDFIETAIAVYRVKIKEESK